VDDAERPEDLDHARRAGAALSGDPRDLGREEQFAPAFTAINPNQKIPAIVDHDVAGGPLAVFESGAILFHLAEKTDRFLPRETRARAATMQWLMYQMSHVGPIIGQAGHFANQAPERIPYAIQRFIGESLRIVGVLNGALAARVPGGRLLDRRHRDLPVDPRRVGAVPAHDAGARGGIRQRHPLARARRRAARGRAGHVDPTRVVSRP
jgi:hypothetical protein